MIIVNIFKIVYIHTLYTYLYYIYTNIHTCIHKVLIIFMYIYILSNFTTLPKERIKNFTIFSTHLTRKPKKKTEKLNQNGREKWEKLNNNTYNYYK